MKTIYDVSLPISNRMITWPGDPGVNVARTLRMEDGDPANVSAIEMGAHTGTHVDAPFHFIPEGKPVDTLPLDVLIGPALVYHLPDVDAIDSAHLDALQIPPTAKRLLFKTRNSDLWARGVDEFQEDYVALTADAARWIAERGVRLVGVDYLSVQRFHDQEPATHVTLLQAGVVVIEGLNLSEVAPGAYDLYCLPLKLVGADGAPSRTILIERDGKEE